MANIVEDILKLVNEDDIEAVVIGYDTWRISKDVPYFAELPKNVLLTWKDAKKWLNYDYDDGYFGDDGCFTPILIWTKNDVFFISADSGATFLQSVPRNPTATEPCMI